MNSKHPPVNRSTFCRTHIVSQADLDFLGHVNNKQYLAWMEQVAWEHAKSVGISATLQQDLNRIMAVYDNTMRYFASCYAGDTLQICTWIGEQKRRCLRERHFRIIRQADKKTVFTALATYVCIDLQHHQPKRIPAEFIDPYFAL